MVRPPGLEPGTHGLLYHIAFTLWSGLSLHLDEMPRVKYLHTGFLPCSGLSCPCGFRFPRISEVIICQSPDRAATFAHSPVQYQFCALPSQKPMQLSTYWYIQLLSGDFQAARIRALVERQSRLSSGFHVSDLNRYFRREISLYRPTAFAAPPDVSTSNFQRSNPLSFKGVLILYQKYLIKSILNVVNS